MTESLLNKLNRDSLLSIFNQVKDFEDEDEDVEETDDILGKNQINSSESFNCKVCDEDSLVYEDGAFFCRICGQFQEVRINQEQEWRYYGDSDSKSTDPTRVGMPTNNLLPESSLGTIISKKGKHTLEFEKIRQYHSWNAMPYKERSLYKIYEKMHSKAIKAGIPPYIIKDSQSMYKELSETQISRGSNRRGLTAACVYIACKLENVPRSSKEIAEIYDLKVNEMTRGVKKFLEIMDKLKNKKNSRFKIQSSSPVDFIQRFCSKLYLDTDIVHLCEYVAFITTQLDIVDENTPPSVAAGSIFLVLSLCNLQTNKKNISDACKISEVTISKCYKKLYKERVKLIPEMAITKYDIKL